MTLDFQLQQVPFTYGLAEGTDPLAVPFGVLTRLENYVWKKHGRVEKRFGVTMLGTLPGALRLLTRGSELCAIADGALYSYQQAAWKQVGSVPRVGLTWQPLVQPVKGVFAADVSVSSDVVVSGWVTGDPTDSNSSGGELWVQASSAAQGSLYLAPTLLAAGPFMGVRVLILGTTALVIAAEAATANISVYPIDLTTFTFPGASYLRTDRVATGVQNWDAQAIAGTTDFVLAYDNGNLRVERFTSALASVANNTIVVGTVRALSVDAAEGESIYVILHDVTASQISFAAFDPTTIAQSGATINFASTGGADAVHVGVCRFDATNAVGVCTFDDAGAAGFATTSKLVTNVPALVANTTRVTYGARLGSDPFMMGGRCYAFGTVVPEYFFGAGPSTLLFTGAQSALLEMNVDVIAGSTPPHPYVANHEAFLAGVTSILSPLSRPRAASATQTVVGLPVLTQVPSGMLHWQLGVRRVDVTLGASAPDDLWRSIDHRTDCFFAGGFLSAYDGALPFDYGFATPPVIATLTTAGAGNIAAGNYLYGGNLEYQGASDLRYRGPTFALTSPLVVSASGTDTLKLVNVNVSAKRQLTVERYATQVGVYRSIVNGTDLHRLTVDPGFNTLPVNLETTPQTLIDARADANIDGSSTPLSVRPAIYTTGGILDDYAPPANVTMFGHVDRLFVLAGDKRRWWFSKTFQDDLGVAPGFHPDNTIAFEEDQTCGGSLDEKAVFFSETKINYTIGLGPAPNGQNGEPEFTTPIKLQTDAGCTQPRSLVSTPDGLMYRSALGIHLLTRGLEVQWIGRSVQDDLDAFPTITSATLVPYASEIRFTCSDGEHGIVLVYNYVEKQWSTAKYLQDADGNGVLIVDACMHAGVWTFVASDGRVFKEDTTTYLDDGVYVPDAIETAWVSGGGPITYQSVRNFFLVGTSHTDHALTVDVGFDSEQAYAQTRTFPARSGVTEVSDLENLQISINTRRKCGSIRFRIRSSTPLAAGSVLDVGRGPSFQTMGIEVGIKQGSPTGVSKKG